MEVGAKIFKAEELGKRLRRRETHREEFYLWTYNWRRFNDCTAYNRGRYWDFWEGTRECCYLILC